MPSPLLSPWLERPKCIDGKRPRLSSLVFKPYCPEHLLQISRMNIWEGKVLSRNKGRRCKGKCYFSITTALIYRLRGITCACSLNRAIPLLMQRHLTGQLCCLWVTCYQHKCGGKLQNHGNDKYCFFTRLHDVSPVCGPKAPLWSGSE